jgi:hypothetical protein
MVGGWLVAISKLKNSLKKKQQEFFSNKIIGKGTEGKREGDDDSTIKRTGKGGGVPLPEACMAGQPRQGLRSHVGTGWVANHG